MKILKERSRVYRDKEYFKYKINIPEEILKEAKMGEGDELEAFVKKGEVHLKKK